MNKNHQEVWDNCLKIIRDNMSSCNFKTWFEPIKPLKLDNNVLTIGIPSLFYYDWLEEHYVDLINSVIKNQIGKDAKLEYNVLIDSKDDKSLGILSTGGVNTKNENIALISNIGITPSTNIEVESLKEITIESNLNEKYSFDNFIEGSCNRLARSAGLAISEKPGGTAFNPLFIYGESGLGKTHLLHAIGIRAKNINPKTKILYVTAEVFGQQFVRALYASKINDFTNFYQQFDLLIVDDIQFLSGKSKIQNTFFTVFNYLHTSGKQIILTCDQAPKDLVGLEDRLLSRFKWGLSAKLDAPNENTRMEILKSKLKTEGITLKNDIIEYVSKKVSGNVRELEGIIISLIAHATFNSVDLDLALVKDIISNTIREDRVPDMPLDKIQELVCSYFNVKINCLNSKTRRREVVQARQISMYLAKKYTKESLKRIGQFYGGKDHSTVIYSCNTINDLVSTDKNIRNSVIEIEKRLINSK